MKRIAIIGGGLAGTACAYMLRQKGLEPVIYEAGDSIAPGASGNALGLYNPRLSAHFTPEAEFYSSAFNLALEVFSALADVDWNPCGALHLVTDEMRAKRFAQAVQSWGWPEDKMRMVDAAEGSEIAGVSVGYDALYLKESGYVSPRKLCAAYAADCEIHLNTKIEALGDIKADACILACGMGAENFAPAKDLPFKAVRGQITHVKPNAISQKLKTNLCYGGYFSPPVNGAHALGASFQRWLDHDQIIEEDDADNIGKLAAVMPELAQGLEVMDRRAGVRTTTKDHFPVSGVLAENVFISTGHGSHGILSALAGAAYIADLITGAPSTLSADAQKRLSPLRFARNAHGDRGR